MTHGLLLVSFETVEQDLYALYLPNLLLRSESPRVRPKARKKPGRLSRFFFASTRRGCPTKQRGTEIT